MRSTMHLITLILKYVTSMTLLVAISLPLRLDAQEKQYTEISGSGTTLFPIAVPPILDGGGGGKTAKTAQEILANDLSLIGLFKLVSEKSYLANLSQEGLSLVPDAWTQIGAQAVIKGRVISDGSVVSFDFYLYDLNKGAKRVLEKSYSGPIAKMRRLVHQFSDDVVHYFTGEKGFFTSRIAFASGNAKSKVSYIYVMDCDGYGAYRFSRTGSQNVLPAWGPDGSLSYTSFLWRNPDLFVVPGGEQRARRIAKYPGLNTGGAWSPNGKEIALTLSRDGDAEIYVIDPLGAILRRLTNNPGIDTSPTWSPDGSQIAFVSNRAGSPQVYVMSSQGGEPKRLTFQGNYNQEPSWNPRKDMSLVAFTGRDERGSYDIFTVDVKTGTVKRLTQGQGSNSSPSWAPNGKVLAFSSSRGGIWVMTHEGLNQRQIYRGSAKTPAWSR